MECGPCAVIGMGAQFRAFSGKVGTGFPSENATTQRTSEPAARLKGSGGDFQIAAGQACGRSSIDLPNLSIN
jgi:hypothetical protein